MSLPNLGLNTGANSPQFGGEPAPVMEAIHAYANERMHAMGTENDGCRCGECWGCNRTRATGIQTAKTAVF